MVNVSFQELAESIQEKRANGMSLDEIWALATEAGISEEEWEQSLLLIRKYRIHEKETKLVSSTINVVWGVVFLIAVFVILFFVFTYRDVFFGKSSEEIQQEEINKENTWLPRRIP